MFLCSFCSTATTVSLIGKSFRQIDLFSQAESEGVFIFRKPTIVFYFGG